MKREFVKWLLIKRDELSHGCKGKEMDCHLKANKRS